MAHGESKAYQKSIKRRESQCQVTWGALKHNPGGQHPGPSAHSGTEGRGAFRFNEDRSSFVVITRVMIFIAYKSKVSLTYL